MTFKLNQQGGRGVDSTGLKLCGAGEWLVEKHANRTRWSWRKLHLSVDVDIGQIVAATLTNKEVDDASQISPLLDPVTGPLTRISHRSRCIEA